MPDPAVDDGTERDLEVTVVDNPSLSRYEARVGAEVPGYAAYRMASTERPTMVFTHTEVDPEFEGRGIGGRLARGALDDVRARGLAVIALCPFIKAWIGKHPDYQDLLAR